jgi:hypothetical protein
VWGSRRRQIAGFYREATIWRIAAAVLGLTLIAARSGRAWRRASSCARLSVKTNRGEPHGLGQQVRPCLVVPPHAGADAQSLCCLGLGLAVRLTPYAQPCASLLESKTPERVGGNLELVRPMSAPAPLADPHFPEQAVISAKRRKDREFDEVLGNVDDTFRPPPLQMMTRRRPSPAPTALMFGVSATMLSPSD